MNRDSDRWSPAQQLIADSFARRAPGDAHRARLLGAGLQALRERGFVAAPQDQVSRAAGAMEDETSEAAKGQSPSAGALAGCELVGAPDSHSPVVLDQGLLYFRVSFRSECELADALAERALRPAEPAPSADAFGPLGTDQLRAMQAASSRWLTVVSGGPGTGKTTAVAALIAATLGAGRRAADIALAAPTGKAAARLNQALRHALATRIADAASMPQAGTLHRLLGWRPQQAGFRHGPASPLPHALVVVDEVSMVDLRLMNALVQALPPQARLVLLGDKDQLVSVQPGSVLLDLFTGLAGHDSLQVLRRNYRFTADSGIAELAQAIRDGDEDRAMAAFDAGHADLAVQPPPVSLDPVVAAYAEALNLEDHLAAWQALSRMRVLCGPRGGPSGTTEVNRRIMDGLGVSTDSGPLTPGALFSVTGNHYGLGLFNGDQGVVRPGADGPTALVERADGALKPLSPIRLPPVEPAFAMTVHRAQGSEFDDVVVLLPDADSPLLTREWLYTAVTRARRSVRLVGSLESVRAAVNTPSQRGSGLAERLRRTLTAVTAQC